CSNTGFSVPDHVVEDMARAIAADYHAGFIARGAAENIHGHRCVSSKSCPGDRMWARMGELQQRVNHYLRTGLIGGGMSWKERIGWGTGWVLKVFPGTVRDTPDGYQAGSLLRLSYAYGRRIWTFGPERWWRWRGLDYVNEKPNSKDHQLAKAHEYSYEAMKLGRRNADKIDALLDAYEGLDSESIRQRIDARADAI